MPLASSLQDTSDHTHPLNGGLDFLPQWTSRQKSSLHPVLSHQGDSRLLYLGTGSWVNSRLKDKRLHSKNRESLLLVLEAEVSGVLGVSVSFAASGRGLCGSAAGWPGAQSSRQMSVL